MRFAAVWSGDSSAALRPARPTTRYVIGLTPFLENSAKDDIYRRIVGMILEDLPQKSSLAIYDAYNLTNITRLEVPDLRAFQSGKTRANQFKEQIFALKQFLASRAQTPRRQETQFRSRHSLSAIHGFPGRKRRRRRASHRIVIGSPLYVDHKEPAFSMVDGYFPSDGHLLASRDQSVFGTKSRTEALQNFTVHFGYIGDPWVSAIHREKIARFWTLYLERKAHISATFCGDLATLFNAARKWHAGRAKYAFQIDPPQTKVEMLRITPRCRRRRIGSRATLSPARARRRPRTRRPNENRHPLEGRHRSRSVRERQPRCGNDFFRTHPRARKVTTSKTIAVSPEREYEFIEFETPVDVNRVQADINYYKGESPNRPRMAKFVEEFEGRIYSGQFPIEATHGNKGRAGSSQTRYWARIDVPAILGLHGDQN